MSLVDASDKPLMDFADIVEANIPKGVAYVLIVRHAVAHDQMLLSNVAQDVAVKMMKASTKQVEEMLAVSGS